MTRSDESQKSSKLWMNSPLLWYQKKKKKKNQVHPQCLATKPSEFILPPSSKVFWGWWCPPPLNKVVDDSPLVAIEMLAKVLPSINMTSLSREYYKNLQDLDLPSHLDACTFFLWNMHILWKHAHISWYAHIHSNSKCHSHWIKFELKMFIFCPNPPPMHHHHLFPMGKQSQ